MIDQLLAFAILIALIFALNLIPVFAPPTWMALAFVGFQFPETSPWTLALVGAAAATLGRLTLALLSDRIVSRKWLSQPQRDNIDVITDERGYRTRKEYDSKRNLLKVTHPDGSSVISNYDPVYSKPRFRTDEAGVTTAWEYDGKANVTKMIEAQGLPEERTTTYTYDQYGQRLTVTRKGSAKKVPKVRPIQM